MAGRKGFDTRRGRPPGNTKSDEVVALILDSIRQGVPIKHACSTFGVSEDCFHLWKNDGKTAKELHAKGEQLTKRQTWCLRFLGQLEAAKSDFVDQGVKLIRKAAKKDWKAASWLLTRRDPEHFAEKQEIAHTGAGGGPIGVTFSPEDREQLGSALEKRIAQRMEEQKRFVDGMDQVSVNGNGKHNGNGNGNGFAHPH
jgi:hypothetical protein